MKLENKEIFLVVILFFPAPVLAYVYNCPPDNSTSLIAAPLDDHKSCAGPRDKHRVTHWKHKMTHQKYKKHHKTKHHYAKKNRGQLIITYVVPAAACCGVTWELSKTQYGEQWGRWEKSSYAHAGIFWPI